MSGLGLGANKLNYALICVTVESPLAPHASLGALKLHISNTSLRFSPASGLRLCPESPWTRQFYNFFVADQPMQQYFAPSSHQLRRDHHLDNFTPCRLCGLRQQSRWIFVQRGKMSHALGRERHVM